MKLRKNYTLSEDVCNILAILKQYENDSISNIIEKAVKKYVKSTKMSPLFLLLKSDPSISFMSKKENEELVKKLDKLTEEDLQHGFTIEI
jgi:predicted CopG family antitoxin